MMHLVVDTNIVLDVLVFEDEICAPLRSALCSGLVRILATAAMREELQRVLDYPVICKRREQRALSVDHVLQQFDAWVDWCDTAPKAPFTCKDPDDQGFIDLACAHRVDLISKDAAVLVMHKRLLNLGVTVRRHWAPPNATA
jgi:predicted nucleic acid-binding protein